MRSFYRWPGVLLAVCLTVAASAPGGGGEGMVRVAGSPEDLRELLREAQWGLLPLGGPILYDAGEALFLPGGEDAEAFLLALLFSTEDWEGAEVTVSEDAGTLETLFWGPGGDLFWWLPPEEGYDPWWAARLLFPGGMPGWADPGWYDPSLVSAAVSVTPLVFPDIPDGAQDAPAQGQAPPPGQGGGVRGAPPTGEVARAALPENGPPPPEGRTNALDTAGGTLLPAAPVEAGAVIYVDAARGDDAWTGRSALSRGGGEGPKRTLAAGMAAAAGGGQLVIGEGAYAERLDLRGTGVRVAFTGGAALGGAAERRLKREGGAVPDMPLVTPPAVAPTGTVVNVQI